MSESREEPFACPIGEASWEAYRRRNPEGLATPPIDGRNVTDPELLPYIKHVDECDDCNRGMTDNQFRYLYSSISAGGANRVQPHSRLVQNLARSFECIESRASTEFEVW